MPEVPLEEKVDFIYKELKSQKKSRYFNIFFKISLLILIGIGVFNINSGFEKYNIYGKTSTKIEETLNNTINKFVNDSINKSINNIQKNINTTNNTKG